MITDFGRRNRPREMVAEPTLSRSPLIPATRRTLMGHRWVQVDGRFPSAFEWAVEQGWVQVFLLERICQKISTFVSFLSKGPHERRPQRQGPRQLRHRAKDRQPDHCLRAEKGKSLFRFFVKFLALAVAQWECYQFSRRKVRQIQEN